jgi:hypothetical protein
MAGHMAQHAALRDTDGRGPTDWTVCAGQQIDHADGQQECSLGAACPGADELHAAGYSCTLAVDTSWLQQRCEACG